MKNYLFIAVLFLNIACFSCTSTDISEEETITPVADCCGNNGHIPPPPPKD